MICLIDGDTLHCKSCNTNKAKTDFHKDTSSKRGYAYYCKPCATAKSRKWHKDNKHNVEYKQAKRDSYFQSKYSLTTEERVAILQKQNNLCAICSIPLNTHGTHTHTDHCHTTGKVRGILCTNCNRGLGHFKDNMNNLENAIQYLRESQT